jgi:hypothetical protein
MLLLNLRKFKHLIIIIVGMIAGTVCGQEISNKMPKAITYPLSIVAIEGYDDYPEEIKKLITKAALLTQMNLTYLYGSANPARGGMDCSGTIYHLLSHNTGAVIPRDANGLYEWVKTKGKLHHVSRSDLLSSQFSQLKPGDLLFWSGTYAKKNGDPITHVMLYIGRNKNHGPLMFGASNGRTYQNKKMCGVSVFDFNLPNSEAKARFVGYGCIPSISCE